LRCGANRAAAVSYAGPRDFLLDVSRLIWRLWSGRLPTGIDRVCLQYVEHFGPRSQALVQFSGRVLVLSPADSDRLFALIRNGSVGLRLAMIASSPLALARARRKPPRTGMIYLNVGHTGLDQAALPRWIARNRVRAVYLIHDLIPITHPHFCRRGEEARHRLRMRNALSSAAGIICNSKATLNELAEFASDLDLPMPPSIAAWISGPTLPERVVPRTLERPHFVTLGTIEGRKNHILLLQIWRSLVADRGKESPILVIIGQRGWEADAVVEILDSAELDGHVRELGRCDDEELAGWLAGARALLMPSFVEGFGLPVIEALQLGTPVIGSDLPVYREIVGDIPTYLDPLDRRGWESAITDFTGDGVERARQMRSMRRYAAPGWHSHFARVEAWLAAL
jgi:glycosyltransferase involved in cell wall biosynthesis